MICSAMMWIIRNVDSPENYFSDSLTYSIVALVVIAIVNNFVSCIALKIKAMSRQNKK